MPHTKYEARPGECISSIAFRFGFLPDTIWNEGKNRELRDKRKDPNVLLAGDVVYIREKQAREESCAVEQRHRFRRKGVPEQLIVQFKCRGELRADEEYVLNIDGLLLEGRTDGGGEVKLSIPPNARRGTITFVESGDRYDLELGGLDPVTELSGVQGRLGNLGFYTGVADGKESQALENAIRAFQESEDLEATGEPDDETRKRLEDVYGG